MPGINIEEIAMPGPGSRSGGAIDPSQYRVRYFRANLEEPGDLGTLEQLETDALLGTDIILLSKDKFSFQSAFFVVITYLEKR